MSSLVCRVYLAYSIKKGEALPTCRPGQGGIRNGDVADQATKQDDPSHPLTLPDASNELLYGATAMKERRQLSPADQQKLEEFMKRYREALRKQPTMSDEEFMAETEVSDEQYAIGLVLPAVANERGEKDE